MAPDILMILIQILDPARGVASHFYALYQGSVHFTTIEKDGYMLDEPKIDPSLPEFEEETRRRAEAIRARREALRKLRRLQRRPTIQTFLAESRDRTDFEEQ
jgi:hypothetical protein